MASSPGDYIEGPRHAVVTPDNVGPVLQIVSLFLMTVMVLAVGLRLLVRFTATYVPGSDDILVSAALLTAIGQVIAVYLTVERGLGTRLALLSHPQLVRVEKGIYALDILYVITLALAKASTLLLLRRLTVSRAHKIAGWVIGAVIVAWTIAGLFGGAFKCELPGPWGFESSQCINLTAFWTAIGVVDIILDVALVIIPITIVWALQMPMQRRITVIVGFSFRLILCVAQVIRMVYLHRYGAGTDTLLSSLGYILATVFETVLAVIVSCIPAFRPFFDRARSGLFAVSFRDRAGTYQMSSIRNSKQQSKASRAKSETPSFLVAQNRQDGDYQVKISAPSSSNGKTLIRQKSDPDQIAQKTVEWEISYSDSRTQLADHSRSSQGSGPEQEARATSPTTKKEVLDSL